jgi:hypothetical protein
VLEGAGRPFHRGRLRYDSAFYLEVSWCADHGLPHSALLGWEPEDRAKLIAYLLESSSKCQQCGTSDWEWEEDRYAYEPITVQCHGCYLKEIARDDKSELPGARISLVPKDVAMRLREKASS